MKVFKFGGASVNSAPAVRNMADIVRRHLGNSTLIVVVSAMGKTTNMLEQLVPGVHPAAEHPALMQKVKDYHYTIIHDLFPVAGHPVYAAVSDLFAQLEQQSAQAPTDYNFDYSQTVCFGELISTTIVSHYLNSIGLDNRSPTTNTARASSISPPHSATPTAAPSCPAAPSSSPRASLPAAPTATPPPSAARAATTAPPSSPTASEPKA